jgi:hypothetical protein
MLRPRHGFRDAPPTPEIIEEKSFFKKPVLKVVNNEKGEAVGEVVTIIC